MKISEPFVRHPSSVGESYGEHFIHACGFGAYLLVAGCACFVHALLPFLFTSTGSDTVNRLHEEMTQRRAMAMKHPLRGQREVS